MGKTMRLQHSKKHKKLKAIDPFYTGTRTADRKAGSANRAPERQNDDNIPYSLKQIIRLKHEAKKAGKRKTNKVMKRHRKDIVNDPQYTRHEKGMTRPVVQAPVFKQRKAETQKQFFNRMERETQNVINRAQFEDKYNVEVDETSTGEMKFKKRQVGVGVPGEEEVISKKQRRNKKKQEKLKQIKAGKMRDQIDNFEEFRDEVKFGEVVMAPPTLTAKPRQMQQVKSNRPGTKSLLLTHIIAKNTGDNQSTHAPKSKANPSTPASRPKGTSVKRKHMSLADQRILDLERERAIEMYRKMKKHKTKG